MRLRSHHIAPAPSPDHHSHDSGLSSPFPSPSPVAAVFSQSTNTGPSTSSPASKFPVEFSPPLIAMFVIIAAALIIITSSRFVSSQFINLYRRFLRWRHRRRREYLASSSISNIDSPTYPFDTTSTFHVFSPGGLVDSAIKTIPLSIYSRKSINSHNCAICLLEFIENDYIRTLPICSHAFHVDCIDIWLRSHANCPLCRACIFRPESPFTPVMATRIRPDLDDIIVQSTILEPLTAISPKADSTTGEEIIQEPSPNRHEQFSEDRYNCRDILLKRSYSFGFERNLGSDRLVVEPVTASPWRYRRGVGSFWSKRPSPFNTLTKSRVFSFRSYRGINMKSPFFRRRGDGSIGGLNFLPLSESSARYSGSASIGGGSSSRRRNTSFASPMFMRSSGASASASSVFYSSSRLRSGDPEALLSPDRYNKR